jgi:hypothetical protein
MCHKFYRFIAVSIVLLVTLTFIGCSKNSETRKVTKVETNAEASAFGVIGGTDENFSLKELVDDGQIYFDEESKSLKKEFSKDSEDAARAYTMLGMYEKESGDNLFSAIKIEALEKRFEKGVLTLDVTTISSVNEMKEINYKIGIEDTGGNEIKTCDISESSKDFTNKIDKTVEIDGLDGYNEIIVKILGGEVVGTGNVKASIEPITSLKINK